MTESWQQTFLEAERLTPAYLETAAHFFDPLAARLAGAREALGRPVLIGLNGSQGSGKSTLCAYLCRSLTETHGLRAIDLSLDDFYLTRAERETLAREVHPLLRTRGVPGTHDMVLLRSCLEALTARADGRVSVPRFDKAEDDRFVEAAWTQIEGPIDVVLLEGWCMGARSVAPAELKEPLNTLELEEDLDGAWRAFVNDSLKSDFEPLYGQIDLWVMLAAPDFEQVLAWRTEQEDKLRAKRRDQGAGLMDPAQLRRFVDHFERVTRQCLSTLPAEVDILLQLNAQRQIIEVRGLET